MNDAGADGGGFLGAQADLFQVTGAAVGVEGVRLAQQFADTGSALGAVRVDGGRADADVGGVVGDVVLQFAWSPQVEHVGAVVGEIAADTGTGDDVAHAQRAHAGQRLGGAGGQRLRLAVTYLVDLDQGRVGDVVLIGRFGQELLGGAQHRHDDAEFIACPFQIGRVPRADGGGDRLLLGPGAQQLVDRVLDLRVGVERHDPAVVAGPVELEPQRVAWIGGGALGIAVEQLPFVVVERAQPMRGLAQVHGDVLALAGAAAPQCGQGGGLGSNAERRDGAEAHDAGHDGVGAQEGDLSAGVLGAQADLGEHVAQGLVDVDGRVVLAALALVFDGGDVPGLGVVAEPRHIRHAHHLEPHQRLDHPQGFRHQARERLGVGSVGDVQVFTICEAVPTLGEGRGRQRGRRDADHVLGSHGCHLPWCGGPTGSR